MTDSSDHLRGAMQAALNTKAVTYREEEATLTITIHKELLNLEEYSITFVKAFLQNSLRGYTPVCGYACRYSSEQCCDFCVDE